MSSKFEKEWPSQKHMDHENNQRHKRRNMQIIQKLVAYE
jgi:hypothetical protein